MNSFRRNCELLRRYGNHFWSANVVGGLGERVLKEMERAANTLNKDATPPVTSAETATAATAGTAAGTTTATSASTMDNSLAGTSEPAAGAQTAMDTVIDSAIGMDHAVDFSVVDPVSGQDVFGHIDPNFNLDAVEEALEANLDIGLPFTWGDWGQYAT